MPHARVAIAGDLEGPRCSMLRGFPENFSVANVTTNVTTKGLIRPPMFRLNRDNWVATYKSMSDPDAPQLAGSARSKG
jgi:hypothetical protein